MWNETIWSVVSVTVGASDMGVSPSVVLEGIRCVGCFHPLRRVRE
jgi:hypothetical protein